MIWPFNKPALQSHSQQEIEARAMERARDELSSRVQLAVVDHNGKRLNERRWRWFRDMVESL